MSTVDQLQALQLSVPAFFLHIPNTVSLPLDVSVEKNTENVRMKRILETIVVVEKQ